MNPLHEEVEFAIKELRSQAHSLRMRADSMDSVARNLEVELNVASAKERNDQRSMDAWGDIVDMNMADFAKKLLKVD